MPVKGSLIEFSLLLKRLANYFLWYGGSRYFIASGASACAKHFSPCTRYPFIQRYTFLAEGGLFCPVFMR